MEYNRDYLKARYNLRRLFKLNRRKSRSKSLKCINVKAPKNISINLLTAIYRLMMTGSFNLLSLSSVIENFTLHNSKFLRHGGHLSQIELLLDLSQLGADNIKPIDYLLFLKSSV